MCVSRHMFSPSDTPLVSCGNAGCLSFFLSFFLSFLSFFLIWGGTCSLCMPALRPDRQAGPVHNPREGTSVVLHDTTRLT